MHPWRLRVSARAGSGKTQLALRFLENRSPDEARRAESGDRTSGKALYLCFNRALAEHMETLTDHTDVHTFHGFCRTVLESAGQPFDVDTRADEPEFLEEVVDRTREILVEQAPSYDTLVVDEGQDFDPEWYETITLCLADDAAILWLEDPLQNLHDRPATVLEGFATWHTRENHRSTRAINRFIEQHLGLAMESANDLPGDPVELIPCAEPDEQIERVDAHVKALIERGFSADQIAILTVHGLDKSPFARVEQLAGERIQRAAGYTSDGHRRLTAGQLTFDSIHRYKGQEAPAVILVDVDFPDWRDDRARRVLYTAMTRAGLNLCIVHAEEPAKWGR
ncbi:MAG: ATP-binding domain-containing protein [Halofilum sp. (in: g-proteobacteria)]|nr:ATP-binding domain-containing protein [Halofilum sp. (in: g-proteobacteria)]